ncbi:putative nucleic acid-binding protein, contains PIN domain [Prauserella aidingensis]|uniref:type II toxin-antitoxin system VapC family toxin n=1 Tax=Prauserella aidingensis TaxID=387890 RepID=UPI0020A30F34|nr:type II toxin-antitoxin system VapC family toxin [Prauserella aidingensis]MCP2253795.1 putative nucleic acid-binding protein, contains PIN domain [Prauserella aidingensis]
MIYLDTSAFLKLVWAEAETPALRRMVGERSDEHVVSSALLSVETRRAAIRQGGGALPRADLALEKVGLIEMSRAVAEAAGRLPDPQLRSLDAIHLATALLLEGDLGTFVTYDKRLGMAAESMGLPVASPA